MLDNLRNMELFVTVASAGGFRAAADRLGLPNSTVSRRIAELERDIGLRLFNRTTRRVELTEAGQTYFDRCRRIIDEARLAHEELSGMVSQPTGLIRASVPVDFTLVYLAEILADFVRAYPGIRLDLDVSPRQSNLVTDPVDLTIRIGEVSEPNLIARKLSTAHLGLFAAPAYLAERGIPATPHDLLHHDCLRVVDRPWRLIGLKGEMETVAVQGSFTANNIGLLHRLARQGLGIAALPIDLTRDDIVAGRLKPVLPDWRPPEIPVYALTETRLLPAKVRVFIDFLIARLKR
ncbi:MAG: LysR family transcriptional regulator [Tabrizicola sp.]|nr:LysR family transcriptional regulator [Tabrizicola sp.]